MFNDEVGREYCLKIIERLRSQGFSVVEKVQYRGWVFAYVAQRAAFTFALGGFAETAFILAKFDTLDTRTLREYSRMCFKYAVHHPKIPLPCGFLHGAACYPVALVHHVDRAVAQDLRKRKPASHLAGWEFPVICDLDTQQLCHFEGTAAWLDFTHGLAWDLLRDTVVRDLTP